MPLGKEVGLGPGHIVSDGDPVETQPPQQPLPSFGPCLLWPNGGPSEQLLSSCYIYDNNREPDSELTNILFAPRRPMGTDPQVLTWAD